MKTLVVTDMHLMEEELPYTKEGVQNSNIILDELIRLVSLDSEIGLIVMLGDITHDQPKGLTTKMLWENKLDKLKRIVNGRHREMPDMKYWGRDGQVEDGRNRLVALKGNHDFVGSDRWNRNKSYFDELVEKGILGNPEALEFTDNGKMYHYHLRNFGEGDKTLREEAINADKVVVFAHDWYTGKGFPEEYVKWSGYGSVRYDINQALSGSDVLIQGHSHSRYQPFELTDLRQVSHLPKQRDRLTVYIPGSNARTPNTDSMCRDDGYNLIIDTEEFEVEDVFIPLKPYDMYFDMERIIHLSRKSESDEGGCE